MSRIHRKSFTVPIRYLVLILILFSGINTLIASPFQSESAGFAASFGSPEMGIGQAPGAPAPSVNVEYQSIYVTLALMVGVLILGGQRSLFLRRHFGDYQKLRFESLCGFIGHIGCCRGWTLHRSADRTRRRALPRVCT